MYMSRQVGRKTFGSGFSLEKIHLVYGCLDNIPATLKAMTSGKSTASYLRIKAYLQDGLAGGRWPPGAQMPSEAELVALFGASRMTVGRAVRELQAEGFVERVQGVGTFAAQPYRASSTLTIRDIHTEISERGRRHAARVKLVREEIKMEEPSVIITTRPCSLTDRFERFRPYAVVEDLCTGCGNCIDLGCPAISVARRERVATKSGKSRELVFARIDPNACTGCHMCAGTCAPAAIVQQSQDSVVRIQPHA